MTLPASAGDESAHIIRPIDHGCDSARGVWRLAPLAAEDPFSGGTKAVVRVVRAVILCLVVHTEPSLLTQLVSGWHVACCRRHHVAVCEILVVAFVTTQTVDTCVTKGPTE